MRETKKSSVVPRLRFPEFRDGPGWEQNQLSDVCEMRAGKFVAASDIAESPTAGSFPCYGGNGLRGYTKSFTHDGRYSLIGRQGALCGNVRLFSGKFHATEHALVVTPTDDVDTNWLCFALGLLNLNQYAIGQAQPGLSVNVLEKVSIVRPPSPAEQREIARCLGSLDAWIGAESAKLEALRSHKKGLMQQLFPRPGESRPRVRFREFHNAGEWKEKTIDKCCKLKAGDFVPASAIAEESGNGLFPCYGGNGLRGYVHSFTHEGTFVLIGRQGALCGNVNLFHGTFHATEHALVVAPHEGIVTNWLYYALGMLNLNRFSIGQAQPGLSVGVLNGVALPTPLEEAEQQRIAACLSSVDGLLSAASRKVEALKQHKRGLMQQLFPTGEGAGTAAEL